jgi:anti-sigma factor RsiW
MTCRNMEANIADVLFSPEKVSAAVLSHVKQCPDCSRELAELRSTMELMEDWKAPAPSPFFDTRLQARLREERDAPPAGWLERLRARVLFGTNVHLRPVMATALTVVLAIGGASYAGFVGFDDRQPTSATVRDLQSLDSNHQLFQQIDSLDQDDDDGQVPSVN